MRERSSLRESRGFSRCSSVSEPECPDGVSLRRGRAAAGARVRRASEARVDRISARRKSLPARSRVRGHPAVRLPPARHRFRRGREKPWDRSSLTAEGYLEGAARRSPSTRVASLRVLGTRGELDSQELYPAFGFRRKAFQKHPWWGDPHRRQPARRGRNPRPHSQRRTAALVRARRQIDLRLVEPERCEESGLRALVVGRSRRAREKEFPAHATTSPSE